MQLFQEEMKVSTFGMLTLLSWIYWHDSSGLQAKGEIMQQFLYLYERGAKSKIQSQSHG